MVAWSWILVALAASVPAGDALEPLLPEPDAVQGLGDGQDDPLGSGAHSALEAVPDALPLEGPTGPVADGLMEGFEVRTGPLHVEAGAAAETQAETHAEARAEPPAPPGPVLGASGAVGAGTVLVWLVGHDLLAGLASSVQGRLAGLLERLRPLLPRWLLAAPFAGLFSRIGDKELADHPIRARMLDLLDARPGASVEEVRGSLGIAWGTAEYHLRRLERGRLVVSQRDGCLHRFWRMGCPEARHRAAASLLKSETPRRIAAAVHQRPGIHQSALCAHLGLKPPVASKYLGRLAEEGLVAVETAGRRRHYRPTEALERLAPQPVAAIAGPREAAALA